MPKRQKVRKTHDVYLSGPISTYGSVESNMQAFRDGARALRDIGLRVFSPPEDEPQGWTWKEYLESDIAALVKCRALVMLPNAERSKGARLEITIAKRLGLPVVSLEEALENWRKER